MVKTMENESKLRNYILPNSMFNANSIEVEQQGSGLVEEEVNEMRKKTIIGSNRISLKRVFVGN